MGGEGWAANKRQRRAANPREAGGGFAARLLSSEDSGLLARGAEPRSIRGLAWEAVDPGAQAVKTRCHGLNQGVI